MACLSVTLLVDKQRRYLMSLHGHIVELQRRHEALTKEVEHVQLHVKTEEHKLRELKRKKLKIKDTLLRLHQTSPQ